MTKPENPNAFPSHNDAGKDYNWIERGMTLRDYFAAAVMTGMYSAMSAEGSDWPDVRKAPAVAYNMADALLKARAI